MTNAELDTLWSRAEQFSGGFTRYRFAALVAAAERTRMIADGWRQCAQGQKTTQWCAQAADRLARHGIQIPEDDDANPSF